MKKLFKCIFVLMILAMLTGCSKEVTSVLSASEQFKVAKQLYDKGKYYKAQLEFEKLIYTYPGNTVIDTAQYYLGMSYYNQKEYGVAIGEFNRLITSYPQSEFIDDAQYQIGMCHYKMSPKYQLDQSETYKAMDAFQTLIVNYPLSEYVSDARCMVRELEDKLAKKKFMTGRLYMKMGDYGPALLYFKYVRDNFPTSDWAVYAFYYSGEALEHLKKYDEALETYNNFLQGFSDHKLADKAKKKIEDIEKKIGNSES